MPAPNNNPHVTDPAKNNPHPADWSKFGPQDFSVELEAVRRQLDNENGMNDIVARLLDMLAQYEQNWQGQVTDLQEKSRRTMQGMVLLGKALAQEKRARLSLQKSVQAMQHATKPAPPVDPAARALLHKSATPALERTALIGKLADQALRLFGPHGGKTVTYDPSLAADMVLKGSLTSEQQRTWKRTGRLPDGVTAG